MIEFRPSSSPGFLRSGEATTIWQIFVALQGAH